jgi:hypothetical protein
VRHRSAAIAQPLHVVAVEPHAVRHGEAVADQAELVHVGRERGAVALVACDHLHLRLGDVAVQADLVLLGEVPAGDQESVAAMVRDGGRHSEPHLVERPFLQGLLDLLGGGLPGRQPEALDLLLERRRQAFHQAGDRLEKGEVGHHRRQHAAHADFLVGLGHRRQAFDRGQRELGGEVVGRGATFQHHLRRADHGGEILVLEIAADADPLAGRQQQLERPAVIHPFGEIARPVGVRVDQPGMHQPVAGVDHLGAGGRRKATAADLGDGVALDQDVDRQRLASGNV